MTDEPDREDDLDDETEPDADTDEDSPAGGDDDDDEDSELELARGVSLPEIGQGDLPHLSTGGVRCA